MGARAPGDKRRRIGTRRRIDRNKVNEIRKVIQRCRDADFDPLRRMFMEYRLVPNATRLEHAAANYPLFTQDKEIKSDVLNAHNKEVQAFNKAVDKEKEQIIAVRHELEDVHGERFRMWFVQIAEGQEAKAAADRLNPIIEGLQEKQEVLLDVANDTELKHELDLKERQLKRLLDRDKDKKKGKKK